MFHPLKGELARFHFLAAVRCAARPSSQFASPGNSGTNTLSHSHQQDGIPTQASGPPGLVPALPLGCLAVEWRPGNQGPMSHTSMATSELETGSCGARKSSCSGDLGLSCFRSGPRGKSWLSRDWPRRPRCVYQCPLMKQDSALGGELCILGPWIAGSGRDVCVQGPGWGNSLE